MAIAGQPPSKRSNRAASGCTGHHCHGDRPVAADSKHIKGPAHRGKPRSRIPRGADARAAGPVHGCCRWRTASRSGAREPSWAARRPDQVPHWPAARRAPPRRGGLRGRSRRSWRGGRDASLPPVAFQIASQARLCRNAGRTSLLSAQHRASRGKSTSRLCQAPTRRLFCSWFREQGDERRCRRAVAATATPARADPPDTMLARAARSTAAVARVRCGPRAASAAVSPQRRKPFSVAVRRPRRPPAPNCPSQPILSPCLLALPPVRPPRRAMSSAPAAAVEW